MTSLDEKIDNILQALQNLSDRVETLEKPKEQVEPTATTSPLTGGSTQDGAVHDGIAPEIIGDDQSPSSRQLPFLGSSDIQKEFDCIRDSLMRQTLPADLKVHDTSTGIKNECRPALKVIQKTARYAETALKILQTLRSPTPVTLVYDNEDINKLFIVLAAQINFLQAEFTNILVKSNFSEETSKIFRSLEATNNPFTPQSLSNLRISAELAAVSSRTPQSH